MKSKFATLIIIIFMFLTLIAMIILGYKRLEKLKEIAGNIDIAGVNTVISNQEKSTQEEMQTPNIVEGNGFDSIERTNNGDYSNVNVDGYLYEQINEYSKIIYKALEANKENMKTGTYTIELGDSFSEVLEETNGQEKLSQYYQSAIEAYIYDNPDIFYLDPNKMYMNIETTTKGNKKTYNVYINNGNDANYLIDEFSSKEQINEAINQMENVKNQILSNKTGDAYKDIKMLHDYLVDNVQYDETISKPNIYNAYGALVNKVAVCEGYARSFKYLLDNLGIPCVLVTGKGENDSGKMENHAWNYVSLDNKWYAVDVTWDDPIVIGGGTSSQSSRYKYFLKGSSEFNVNHYPSNQFTQDGMEFTFPELRSINY